MANSAGTMPNTGRWGWYKDHEGNEFRRVTTLVKKVETDTFYLEQWKSRQVLLGAAVRDDIVMAVKAMGTQPALGWTTEQKKKLAELAEQCMTAAGSDTGKILGTAVHDLTERVDRGEPIDDVCRGLPDQAAAGLRAYAKLRKLNGWKSVEIERTVVCDIPGIDPVGGSFDRIDVVPGLAAMLGNGDCQYGHGDHKPNVHSELAVIVDVKTEGDPLKNGLHIGPQLAIYSRAKRMWMPEPDRYVPAPCVRQDVAIIVHVRDGKAIPYFVDLTAGWEAAQAAARQIEREKAARKWFAPVPGITEPKPAEVLTEVAVAGQYASPTRVNAEYGQPSTIGTALATAMLDASKMAATALGPAPMPGTVQVAERGADGLVRWHEGVNEACSNCASLVASATRVDGTCADENCHQCGQRPDLTETPEMAQVIQAIRLAGDLVTLGHIWQRWTDAGNAWEGPVANAGERRRRIIECPQAALHQGAGRCACGWPA
jgi:hypothetical protein